MDEIENLKEYKKYIKSMLDSYSNTLTKVMFDDFKVRAISEKDDEFATFTMYLNILIASLQRKDKEVTKKTEELIKHQDHLEEEITKRTKELEMSKKQLNENIKELKQSEAAALNIMEDLQKTLDDLQDSKEMIELQNIQLKKLDKLKSDFLNVTSHELRTPMSAIKGYIQMILKQTLGQLTDEQRKALNVALRNTNRLDSLIQDILDVSRLESGTMKFIPEKTYIKTMLEESVATMKISADLKHMTIKTEIEDKIPELTIDQERIKQVMLNIINNAIKFSPDGSIINVRAKKEEKNILFEIQDFGRGYQRINRKKSLKYFTRLIQEWIENMEVQVSDLRFLEELFLPMGEKFGWTVS